MNITKLLVVVFIAALCNKIGASQLRGIPNDTKLMDQKSLSEDIVNSLENITRAIIDTLGNNTTPINTTIPTLPNNTSPAVEIAPSVAPQGEATNGTDEAPLSGDIVGVVPSPIQEGGAINGTETPLTGGSIDSPPSPNGTEASLSGAAIGIDPSLLPIDGGTETPLSGDTVEFSPPSFRHGGDPIQAPLIRGVIGTAPPRESRAAPATNDIEAPVVVNIGVTHVSTEGETVYTTNNFGSEDGTNGGSVTEP